MLGYKPHLPTLNVDLTQEIVRRVVEAVHPEKIILFGSRARGDHRPESDIDLLVIQRSNLARHRRAVPIYRAMAGLPIEVDMEVVVYTPSEVEDWRHVRQAFVTTALREGKLLYESAG